MQFPQTGGSAPTTANRPIAPAELFRATGFPGMLVVLFVGSFFAAKITCDITVLLLYGGHAFFNEGLRVADWKHSILSNGAHLPWWGTLMIGPPVVPLTLLMVLAAEFALRRSHAFLASRSRWMTVSARFLGGIALFGFSFWLYSPPLRFAFIHPIPLSALIGGSVLLRKTALSVFRTFPS